MSFPSGKTHYPSRRHPTKGAYPVAQGVACTITFTGSTATLTFSRPVIVTGPISLSVPGATLVTQTTVSPTVVTQLYSVPLSGLTYTLQAMATNVATYQGGPVAGTTGTFRPAGRQRHDHLINFERRLRHLLRLRDRRHCHRFQPDIATP